MSRAFCPQPSFCLHGAENSMIESEGESIIFGKIHLKLKENKLAKLIVLPSALKDTEGCRRHRRTMKAMKGIKGNEGIEYAKALSFPF